MVQLAAVCDADEPALRTYSESTLRSIHKNDLIAFGENFCGIKFPEGAKQDAVVQRVHAHIALKGRGSEHVAHLVAQAQQKSKLKKEEKKTKKALSDADARLATANRNREVARRALEAATAAVERETQSVAAARAAYESAQNNTRNFSA
ncbi:unnamed protein product [Ectocarpus sp. 6 AP-2014]